MFINKFLLALLGTFIRSEAYSLKSLRQNFAQIDYKVIFICVLSTLVLTLTYYFGDYRYLISLLRNTGFNDWAFEFQNAMTAHPDAAWYRPLYWAIVVIFFYFVIPAVCIKLILRENFTEYGVSFKGAFKYTRLYLWMLVIMVPLVIYFSASESFLAMYPFYKIAPGEHLFPKFFIWEAVYFFQFFALEFLFRGFILHGTKHRFGFYAIFFMIVPYCMIHFGKPMTETIAAIIAGVILGYMSLKSRNIWMGVVAHCSVALTMDISALFRKGVLGDQEDLPQ